MSFDTPVVLIVFNRPHTTQRVFEVISQIRPKQLFIVADAPRANHPTDAENCAKVRSIVEQVNWSCEVYRNYADTNMGCRDRVSSGITWALHIVNEAIILEDDCLANLSFFRFCQEMLDRYRHDMRVMHISGSNFQLGRERSKYSYYFSKFAHIWGWATWSRAWQYYDVEMKLWNFLKETAFLDNLFANKGAVKYWQKNIQKIHDKLVDTWDAQWVLACWMQNGLCIVPKYNLVSNIGFGLGATHTFWKNIFAELPTKEMEFPLIHPPFMVPNRKADQFIENVMFNRSIISRIRRNLGVWV